MMRRFLLALCLVVITLSGQQLLSQQGIGTSGSSGAAIQSIVDQFYPQQLIDPAYPSDRYSCFAVFQTTQDGQASIVIANYLNVDGAIRILTRAANGTYNATEGPQGLDTSGAQCSIELIDIDGDGRNEIHLSTSGATAATSDWIFQWDGSSLSTLNPTTQMGLKAISDLGNVQLVDLYHDGTLAAYSVGQYPPPQDNRPDVPDSVFRLQNGRFQESATALCLGLPVGDPSFPYELFFGLAKGSTGPYTLRVINGDSQGNHRASGQILLNGTVLTTLQSRSDAIYTIPITLASDNQVTVEFATQYADSAMALVVEDNTPAPPAPSNLAAISRGSTQIDVSWAPSASNGVYAYHVYRDVNPSFVPSSVNLIRGAQYSPTTLRDHGLTPSTTYYYFVEAEGGYGSSAPSNEASATTSSQAPASTTPPSAPTGPSVQALGTQNNLSWTASTTADVT